MALTYSSCAAVFCRGAPVGWSPWEPPQMPSTHGPTWLDRPPTLVGQLPQPIVGRYCWRWEADAHSTHHRPRKSQTSMLNSFILRYRFVEQQCGGLQGSV